MTYIYIISDNKNIYINITDYKTIERDKTSKVLILDNVKKNLVFKYNI